MFETPRKNGTQISSLNFLRFVAAFWVLAFHANIHIQNMDALWIINPLLNQGVLAMTLFFTLSGFILSWRYAEFNNYNDFASFFAARIARLYPVYIFMGAVTIFTLPWSFEQYNLSSNYSEILWAAGVIALFLLALQAWAPALFGVWNFNGSWSLSVEAFFYSMFPLLRRFLKRQKPARLLIIVALCLGLSFIITVLNILESGDSSMSRMYYVVPIFRIPEFIIGATIFVLIIQNNILLKEFSVISIILAFISIILIWTIELPGLMDFTFLAMLPFSVLFCHCLRWEFPRSLRGTANYLGHISYCLYLVQFGTVPLIKAIILFDDARAQWLAFIVVNLLLSIAVFHAVESSLYTSTRRVASRVLHGVWRQKVGDMA